MKDETKLLLNRAGHLLVTVFDTVVDVAFYGSIFVVGVVIGFGACHYRFGTVMIPGEVMTVGNYVCKPNDGLKFVAIQDVAKRDNHYTFACNNQARFLNVPVVIVAKSKVAPEPKLKLDTTPLAQTAGVSGSKISTKEKK